MTGKTTRTRRKQTDDKDLGRAMGRLANNILSLRKDQGLSQQVLATRSGIAITTLSDIERGQAFNLKLSTLISIARQLKVRDFTDLFR